MAEPVDPGAGECARGVAGAGLQKPRVLRLWTQMRIEERLVEERRVEERREEEKRRNRREQAQAALRKQGLGWGQGKVWTISRTLV